MAILGDDIHSQIITLCKAGDELAELGRHREAIEEYERAWSLLPEPWSQWEASTQILAAIGEAHFATGRYADGREVFSDAVHCPGAIGNAFLHLRLGQCQLELGNREKAADELARAYMGGGIDIFKDEDPKYLELVKSVLKEPAEGW